MATADIASETGSDPKRLARRREIFAAAARVFHRKGYHGTRIQDVADELGMRKGSLYYYISSKEDLLRGLVEGPIQQMIDEAQDVLATRHSAPRKLALVIESHLRCFQEHKDVWGIFLREDLDLLNRNAACDVRRLARQYHDLWEQLLREGMDSGEFDPDLEPRVVVKAIIGMCDGTYTWFRPDGTFPIREIARIFAGFALKGVEAR